MKQLIKLVKKGALHLTFKKEIKISFSLFPHLQPLCDYVTWPGVPYDHLFQQYRVLC